MTLQERNDFAYTRFERQFKDTLDSRGYSIERNRKIVSKLPGLQGFVFDVKHNGSRSDELVRKEIWEITGINNEIYRCNGKNYLVAMTCTSN